MAANTKVKAPMRVHVLQHVPFEGPGSIGDWLAARRAKVTCTRLFAGDALPTTADHLDLLIALGGPMSVNDEAELPWLVREKTFVRQVMAAGRPMLGVCLGAQLIASALGARVTRQAHKEIGWFPVRSVDAPPGCAPLPARFDAFHWHGETFDLPPRAIVLAETDACPHQAFQVGRRVIGLQFHLEVTPAAVGALVANCRDELIDGPYIQTARQMMEASPAQFEAGQRLMRQLLDYLCSPGD